MTLTERAKAAAKAGYAISENAFCAGVFHIHRPDGARYTVETDGPAPVCNCPASVTCKHIGLVELCRAYWTALDRRQPAPRRVAGAGARPHFSRRHLAAVRGQATSMARAARVAATIDRDFPAA